MTCRLSILMPTYNGARFLAEQIGSILAQSFSDFELLIVDDGSTDGTPGLLRDVAARDARIRLIPSAGNRGQNARIIELVTASTADLIALSDQDDIWHPDKLRLLVDAMDGVSLAFGPSQLIDETGASLDRTLLDQLGVAPAPDDRLVYLFKPTVSAHAMVIRRTSLSMAAFQRFHWFDQLFALEAMFSGGVRWVPEAITYHRIHGANQCNTRAMLNRKSAWRHVTPRRLGNLARDQRYQRMLLVQRFEHLGYSHCLPAATAASFLRLAKLCFADWFGMDAHSPLDNKALRTALVDALYPMRGSDRDWEESKYRIDALTRAALHPRNLYRLGRDFARELLQPAS